MTKVDRQRLAKYVVLVCCVLIAGGFFLPWTHGHWGFMVPAETFGVLSLGSSDTGLAVFLVWLIIAAHQLLYLLPVCAGWLALAFVREWPRRTALTVWIGVVVIFFIMLSPFVSPYVGGWHFGLYITSTGAIGLLAGAWLNAER